MDDNAIKTFAAMPPADSHRRIDFDTAKIVAGRIPDTWFLTVSGTKPWLTMTVRLMPLLYIRQPEYWGIEVVGEQSGLGLPAKAPYSVTIDVTHLRGTAGIEVIGANKTETLPNP